jgi:glycosyltransferase involved in cell wall biosynthesis
MACARGKNDLLVMGVHLSSEGYPNTRYRLSDLRESNVFSLSEINVPMWSEATQNRQGLSRLTRNLWRAFFAHAAVFFQYLISKRTERVYIPYPAVFLLVLLSLLPRRARPRTIVTDVFISIYDTVVNDRRLLNREGIPARLLKWMEKRAYDCADKLIVDTEQNARFLCTLFNLDESKVKAIPLSTDEDHFKPIPYRPEARITRVLFVGTLVPLHGIKTILSAATLLSDRPDIHFKLIGDGHEAPVIESWLQTSKVPLEWKREWQPSEKIAEEISRADICLGIFGSGNKTHRVCPFKIYAYASMGRPIITGDTDWLQETSKQLGWEPFASVPVSDPTALAAKIVQLIESPTERVRVAESARKFYKTCLSNEAALAELTKHLLED